MARPGLLALLSPLSPSSVVALLRRLLGGAPADAPSLPAPRGLPTVAEASIGGVDVMRRASRQALVAAVQGDAHALSIIAARAQAIADAPVVAARYDGRDVVDLEDTAAPLRLLRAATEHYQGGLHEYVGLLASDAMTDGNAYAELRGEPTPRSPGLAVLVRLDPGDVTPVASPDGLRVERYRVSLPDRQYDVPADRMVHVRPIRTGAGADGLLGTPPLLPLLPELAGDRALAAYLADRPHGQDRGLMLRAGAGLDAGQLHAGIGQLQQVRARTGYHLSTQGLQVEALGQVGAAEDEGPLRDDLRRRVVASLGEAEVVYGFSVTNDSAASVQLRRAAESLRDLSASLWRAHAQVLARVLSPAERAQGVHLRSDWSDLSALDGLAERSQRLALVERWTAIGADPAAAAREEGIAWPSPAGEASAADAGLRLLARGRA